MAEQGNGRFEAFGRKIDEHFGTCGERLEDDVKKVITYLNEKVVPEVRENSSKARRAAATARSTSFGPPMEMTPATASVAGLIT